jgi:hypothetical protein
MWSRAQWLNRQVNSFLCSCVNDLEDKLLPNDLIIITNHGGHVGHQEGAGKPREHTQHGGEPIQFRVMKSDFESNSKSRSILPWNWCTWFVWPLIWVTYILRRLLFQCHGSHGQLKSVSAAIVETRKISRTILVLHHLFWADGPCIEFESTRDASLGSAMTPSLYI